MDVFIISIRCLDIKDPIKRYEWQKSNMSVEEATTWEK